MALFGQIGEFVPGEEDWPQYVERLEHFLCANGIETEERRRAVFLATIGPKVYKLLCSLLSPVKPVEKSLAQLVAVLNSHYSPKPSVIVERYRFHSRFRKSGESVVTFVSELRSLAKNCNFGPSLDDMLRDRLVCGINDDNIQRRLLSEAELTLDSALRLALSHETAARNARELQSSAAEQGVGVHKVDSSEAQSRGATASCYRCGKWTHSSAQCPFKEAKCYNCGKKGHTRNVCRSRPQKVAFAQRLKDPHIKLVEPERGAGASDPTDDGEEYGLFQLKSEKQSRPLEVPLFIDGHLVMMELDTGAAVSLVSEATFKHHWTAQSLEESTTQLRTYSGEPLLVLGQLNVEVQCGEQCERLPLLVVEGEGSSLLGRDWLRSLQLDWKNIHRLQSDDSLERILACHKEVFSEGLGTLKGFKAKLHIDVGAKPRFCKARTVPYSMRGQVEKELDRLVSEGILEQVQFSEWAAPIVPVLKADKSSVRICGDFKLTVNRCASWTGILFQELMTCLQSFQEESHTQSLT